MVKRIRRYLEDRPGLVAALFRLLFLIYGAVHDRYSSLKYQDIDYVVISDAARSICATEGSSMYSASPEYRYPPVLAWAVAAVDWPHCVTAAALTTIATTTSATTTTATTIATTSAVAMEAIGVVAVGLPPPLQVFGIRPSKLLFALADVVVVLLIDKILCSLLSSRNSTSNSNSSSSSSRSSSNSGSASSTSSTSSSSRSGSSSVSGSSSANNDKRLTNRWVWFWALNPFAAVIATRGSFDAGSNALTLATLAAALGNRPSLCGIALGTATYLRLFPVIYLPALAVYFIGGVKPVVTSAKCLLSGKSIFHNGDGIRKSNLINVLKFSVSAVVVCSVLVLISYYFCGDEYLHSALLYHLTRLDHRHNFSPQYLHILLRRWVDEAALRRDLMLTSTLPQLGLIVLSSVTLSSRNIIAALLVNTMILVAFNKVCTAQYFTWFAVFAPLLLGQYDLSTTTTTTAASSRSSSSSSISSSCASSSSGASASTTSTSSADRGSPDAHERELKSMTSNSSNTTTTTASRKHILVAVGACAIWLASMGLWLLQAYRLEFLGHDVFIDVWVASLIFQACTVLLIAVVVYATHRILPPLTPRESRSAGSRVKRD